MNTNVAYESAGMCALIDKARGQRSLSEYGRACGISAAHISRICSGICRPTRKICYKLAEESAKRGISEKQFLNAAGYSNETETEDSLFGSAFSFVHFPKELEETVYVGIIAKALGENGCTYQLLPKAEQSIGEAVQSTLDFSFAVEQDETVARWNFYGEAVGTLSSVQQDAYYYYVGRLMSCRQNDREKHTLLLRDIEMFRRIKECLGEGTARTDLSVALVDFPSMKITDEIVLGSDGRSLLPS